MPVEDQSESDDDPPEIVMVRRTRQRLYDGTDAKLFLFPTLGNILLTQMDDDEKGPEPKEAAAAASASAKAPGTNPSRKPGRQLKLMIVSIQRNMLPSDPICCCVLTIVQTLAWSLAWAWC